MTTAAFWFFIQRQKTGCALQSCALQGRRLGFPAWTPARREPRRWGRQLCAHRGRKGKEDRWHWRSHKRRAPGQDLVGALSPARLLLSRSLRPSARLRTEGADQLAAEQLRRNSFVFKSGAGKKDAFYLLVSLTWILCRWKTSWPLWSSEFMRPHAGFGCCAFWVTATGIPSATNNVSAFPVAGLQKAYRQPSKKSFHLTQAALKQQPAELSSRALGVSLKIRDDKDSLQGANSEIGCSLSYV